ncbi:glycophorin-C [Pyxicephalus adspersus]
MSYNRNDSTSPPPTVEDSSSGTDAAVITSVIIVVIVVLVILIVVVLRYKYRHKGTYLTNEAKDMEFAENANTALKNDSSLHDSVDESKKEYFI